MIKQAEELLHHHHAHGRHHLTQALEHEIEETRKLEHELMALEQHRHMDIRHIAEVEERLLHHENRIIEALTMINHHHQREWEENHNREHGHREEEPIREHHGGF